MKKKILKFEGFSLIELVVVCAIIGIMCSVFLVYINAGNREKKEVEVAARNVAAAIRETQNYALNGNVVNTSDRPCQYGFESAPDGNSAAYAIKFRPNSGGACNGGGWVTVRTGSLENGVVFSSNDSVRFSLPHGTKSNASQFQVLKNNRYCMAICINDSGRIVEKPNTNRDSCPSCP